MVMAMLPGLLGAVAGAVKKKKGGLFGAGKPRRRRRARLTASELGELNQIKAILGKTAAANALPFYMGRR